MKITGKQLFWTLWMLEVGMNLLISIAISAKSSRQDVWLSFLVAGGISLLVTYIAASASLRHPDQTMVQYAVTILGKWPGKLIVIPYFLQWIWVMAMILREEFSFIRLNVLYKTPDWIIIGSMFIVVIYAVSRGGIEVIGRCSELWGPILSVILLLTFVLTLHNLKLNHILPVYYDSGILAIAKGSLPPASLFSESIVIMMLIPYIKKSKTPVKRYILGGVLISVLTVMLGSVWVILTFGPEISSRLNFPFFEMVKMVYLMEFIQNMDIFVMAIWLVSIFIKMCAYLFVASVGISQWIGKADQWKRTLWFVAAAAFLVCMGVIRLNPPTEVLLEKIWIHFVLPVNMIGIPLLLLCISRIRFRRKQGAPSA
ncbi:hypothetical protein C2I18_27715 [Paenibacillus sp. PK3_47]|uniref:GerAB/ArcD/ProY family transporter n=1 Tax=Paenibacillus sp. PK3_47 TaxID=2072642 RepID=UPI00201D3E99|nr:endospore germination permease [Paenibacillus sp. PK3_47]UQZ36987.1 hypothetical protein C2I18_27715 [Paenibacillus sp. PK3_47]